MKDSRTGRFGLITSFAILFSLVFFEPGKAQKFEDKITTTYQLAKTLYVANANGDVTAEGYDGTTVELEAHIMLDGKNRVDIEELKRTIKIEEKRIGDSLIIYIAGIGRCFCQGEGRFYSRHEYFYDFNDWDYDFDFNVDFKIKVPHGQNLRLSTINNGEIEVHKFSGKLNVRNINGGIRLVDIEGPTKARTINGDVDIKYKVTPSEYSGFYSLNGDINAYFTSPLQANITFKSFNGDLFTNVEEITQMPTRIEKTDVHDGRGISYKIGERSEIKFRNGGVLLDFETFNGNVYVKETQ